MAPDLDLDDVWEIVLYTARKMTRGNQKGVGPIFTLSPVCISNRS